MTRSTVFLQKDHHWAMANLTVKLKDGPKSKDKFETIKVTLYINGNIFL